MSEHGRFRPRFPWFISDEIIWRADLRPWQVTAIEEELRKEQTRLITEDDLKRIRGNYRRGVHMSGRYGHRGCRCPRNTLEFVSKALNQRGDLRGWMINSVIMMLYQQQIRPTTEDALRRKYRAEIARDLIEKEQFEIQNHRENDDAFPDDEDIFPPYKIQYFEDLRRSNCLGLTIAAPFVKLGTSSIDKKRLVSYYVEDEQWMEPDVARNLITYALFHGYCYPKKGAIRIIDSFLSHVQVPPGFDPALQVFMTQVWSNDGKTGRERKQNSEEDGNHV